LAWKVVGSRRLKKTKGFYEGLLAMGEKSQWMNDIMKDVDRTFPAHPYFNKDNYGNIG